MPERLSAQDASFLYVERPATPMHVGIVAIFEPTGPDWATTQLPALIEQRLDEVPRFRQRLRTVPGHLANPLWVDDTAFDLSYHVRRSALPRPGSMEQLRELAARLHSRLLDRRRPLWELYIVEGLAKGRIAVITKTHQALVDGVTSVDLSEVILDPTPDFVAAGGPEWEPAREPSWYELVAGAVGELVRQPLHVTQTVRAGVGDMRSIAAKLGGTIGALRTAARLAGPPAPASPLNTSTGAQRRYSTVSTDLDVYRRVRARSRERWESLTVNDVVLAAVTGALRSWLLSRGESVDRAAFLRALVPVSVRDGTAGGVASYFVDLPIGEPDPIVRLDRIGFRMKAHNLSGQRIGADALAGLSGFAPPTLHAVGARVAAGLSGRTHNLVITNVPGPQEPRYAAGARLLESYPIVPIPPGHALAIGVTSYVGEVRYGLMGDRDAMADLDTVAELIPDALDELAEVVLA